MSADVDTTKPWPHWMLDHMLQDDADSMENLIWSVGGSPPYGGISYEEAAAVYALIEDFRGPGRASPARFEAARRFLKQDPHRARMLELFRCYDAIVSDPGAYAQAATDEGLEIATQMHEQAAIGLFQLFHAGVLIRAGKNAAAAERTVEALENLLQAAEGRPACAHRVESAAQNAVVLTAMAGDRARAGELLADLSEVLPAKASDQLRRWLAAQK